METQGRRRGAFGWLPTFRPSEPRRERSLSKALRNARERLILLEGDPGAGKSVALRHTARKLADVAAREHDPGSWLFLFDSFDEIPAVLSAVEPDRAVGRFSEAIADFFAGMNQCRGIVATRQFRGPRALAWPRFRVLRLSASRQRKLVRRADLSRAAQETLYSSIHTASSDIQAMSSNPMFLGLLCEHMRATGIFPQHSHNVFESYFTRRLSRDSNRVKVRFGLEPKELLQTAETVAFAMTGSRSIGLSPTRGQLAETLTSLGIGLASDALFARLDALEYLKLARSESESIYGGARPLTFAHRRFQEYFATLRVLHDTRAVSAEQLLYDGRWRETAVVLLQTQAAEAAGELLAAAASALERETAWPPSDTQQDFPWGKTLHVLGILQDGFSGRAEDLPDALRQRAATLVNEAIAEGTLADHKLALEHAGILPNAAFELVVNGAFESTSRWLQDTAFLQLARLVSISARIREQVLRLLQHLLVTGRLRAERYAVRAQMQRLNEQPELLPFLRLFLAIPLLDAVLHLLSLGILLDGIRRAAGYPLLLSTAVLAAVMAFSWSALRMGLSLTSSVGLRVLSACAATITAVFAAPDLSWRRSAIAACCLIWAPLAVAGAPYARKLNALTLAFLPLLPLRAIEWRRLRPLLVLAPLLAAPWLAAPLVVWAPPWLSRGMVASASVAVAIMIFGLLTNGAVWLVRVVKRRLAMTRLRDGLDVAQLEDILQRQADDTSKALILAHVRTNALLRADAASVAWICSVASALHSRMSSPDNERGGNEPATQGTRARYWIRVLFTPQDYDGDMAFKGEVYRLREQLLYGLREQLLESSRGAQ